MTAAAQAAPPKAINAVTPLAKIIHRSKNIEGLFWDKNIVTITLVVKEKSTNPTNDTKPKKPNMMSSFYIFLNLFSKMLMALPKKARPAPTSIV
jgi:hypothetical protein